MNKNPKPKAIIGLGNPGKQYSKTKHNIGFQIINQLAELYHATWYNNKNLEYAEININGNHVLLIKPQTFMNSSGLITPFIKNKNIKPEEILVIHDELELPFGRIALKFGGSTKGHNGLKSIIANLTDQFWRLRFGIGRPEDRNLVPDYVLENFSKSEDVQSKIDESINIINQLYLNN